MFLSHYTSPTDIYTLSLHDALPIWLSVWPRCSPATGATITPGLDGSDRKSTRLNSSHQIISYAVFCLKKKKVSTFSTQPASRSRHFLPALPLHEPRSHCPSHLITDC